MRYDRMRYPGSQTASSIANGANCQSYAYAVLRYFGRNIPEFRSSELWEDDRHTFQVATWATLDLLLFNRTHDAFAAHVGVYAGEGLVLHLCKAVGRPALWRITEFAAHARYGVMIGAKRVHHGPKSSRVAALGDANGCE